jgi:hypothetical protein
MPERASALSLMGVGFPREPKPCICWKGGYPYVLTSGIEHLDYRAIMWAAERHKTPANDHANQ